MFNPYMKFEMSTILGSGAAFAAQKHFLANVEAAVEQAGDTSVVKFQDVLQYARGVGIVYCLFFR